MSPEQRRYKEVFGLDLPANPALEFKEERHNDENKDAFTKKVSSKNLIFIENLHYFQIL